MAVKKLHDVHSIQLANLGYSHHYIKTVVLCRVKRYFTSRMLDTASADNLYKNRKISRATYIQLDSIYSNYCNDYSMGIIRTMTILLI
jgi:hypothetical protein